MSYTATIGLVLGGLMAVVMEQLGRLRGVAGQRTTDLAADLRRISQQEPIAHGGPILVTKRKLPAPQFPDMFLRPLVNAHGNLLEEDPALAHFQKWAGVHESDVGHRYDVKVHVGRPRDVSVYLTPEQVRGLRKLGKLTPSDHPWTVLPGRSILVTAVIDLENATLKRDLLFVPGRPGQDAQVFVDRHKPVGGYGAEYFLGGHGNAALDVWQERVLRSLEDSNIKVYHVFPPEVENWRPPRPVTDEDPRDDHMDH